MDVRVGLWRKLNAEEWMLLNCGVWEDSWGTLNCKEIKPVSPKGNPSWIFIERTDAKTPIFGHLMWETHSLEKTLMLGKIEGQRRRGQQKMRWFDSITNSMGMNVSKLRELVKDKEASYAVVHGVAKNWTWLSDRTAEIYQYLLSNGLCA